MRPRPPEAQRSDDLFRARLAGQLDPKHKLVRLAGLIDWQRFEDSAPALTGRDVRDLGYKPGPVFTKIFEALRQARWEGKLRTREEEIRFLQNTFPIQNGH